MQQVATLGTGTMESVQQRFVTKVYGWMCAALLTTALVAYYVVADPNVLRAVLGSQPIFFGLIIAELGLVLVLSWAINRLSVTAATALFFLYAALTGATLSVVFVVYTRESLTTAFLVTAGTFGAMSFYGLVTRRDLTSLGNLLFMGLIGIIIASVVNMFFASTLLYTITSYVGVLVFVGLTAYDTQKMKQMATSLEEGSDTARKGAIMGALALYLDFINLFLMLLRIFGKRR